MRQLFILLLLPTLACQGEIQRSGPPMGDGADTAPDAGGSIPADAGPTPDPDSLADGGPSPDAAAPPLDPTPEAGLLASDLRVTRVDLFQSVRVPLAIDGSPAERDGLPVVAGREALVRVHVEALSGWHAREVSAVVEVDGGDGVQRFLDTRVPVLPSDEADPETGFTVLLPGEALVPGASFRVRLEAADGVAEAPEALYPPDGGLEDLGVEILGAIVIVLVPFRYDTDGSGRLPDTSDPQLARYRDELTSRFPFAEVDLRVHEVVPWNRSTRSSGNMDWGAVNSTLIAMRDAEDAGDAEYWYGLVAPHESRASYCDSVWGGCVTGQSYVATLHGTRVGSGVGFGDVASVRTFAHELGHMHGRYHAPCGTRGTDERYPYDGGLIGTWGWDRRDGSFHDPDTASDLLGYCRRQWISDYNYRAIYERHLALRGTLAWPAPAGPPAPHRFVTLEDGAIRWSGEVPLRRVPGEPTFGVYLDGDARPVGRVEVGSLDPAHGDERVWVVPGTWPEAARTLIVDGERLPAPLQ